MKNFCFGSFLRPLHGDISMGEESDKAQLESPKLRVRLVGDQVEQISS